ncbi:fimbrial protein [Serratia sp. TEL]|nr:fimbrial protein [Serratia sp. TEL]
MKGKAIVALVLLLGGGISQVQAGGIVLQRTRVIYEANKKEAALPLANHANKMPYLIQSWIENEKTPTRGPFIITPPLFRLNAGDDSSLRIIKTEAALPDNKESLFYLNVRAIPAFDKSQDEDENTLTLVFKTRIKLFYRPAHLKGKSYDAYKTLEYRRNGSTLTIYNPSDYYVVFAGLIVGKTELTDKIEYIAPGEHKQLPLPSIQGNEVKWAAINDYGGRSKTETRALE